MKREIKSYGAFEKVWLVDSEGLFELQDRANAGTISISYVETPDPADAWAIGESTGGLWCVGTGQGSGIRRQIPDAKSQLEKLALLTAFAEAEYPRGVCADDLRGRLMDCQSAWDNASDFEKPEIEAEAREILAVVAADLEANLRRWSVSALHQACDGAKRFGDVDGKKLALAESLVNVANELKASLSDTAPCEPRKMLLGFVEVIL